MTTESNARPLAVVTGASSGIGYELAKVFAEHGYDLIIVSDSERIREAARSLGGGTNVVPFEADLSTPGGVESLVGLIRDSGRPVDSVVINAGIGVGGDFARETSLEDELRLLNLNVNGSVHLAKRMAQDMVKRNAGRILFTSSIAATMPAPLEAVYGASKAFLLSFSEALRDELKDAGVTVTALMPGPTETNFFHRAEMDETKVGREEKDDPAKVARQGFDALMSGDDKVVAGSFKNRVQAAVARVLPDSVKAKQHRKLARARGRRLRPRGLRPTAPIRNFRRPGRRAVPATGRPGRRDAARRPRPGRCGVASPPQTDPAGPPGKRRAARPRRSWSGATPGGSLAPRRQ